MAYFLLIIGVLTLFGLSLLNALSGLYDSAFKIGLLGVMLVVFSVLYIFCIKPINKKTGKDKLIEWLFENEQMVSNYGSRYKGQEITNETVLVKFAVVYSGFFFTRKTYTNFYVLGTNTAFNVKLFSTVFNLVMGWWNIPGGLVETPKSVYENLFSKYTVTVDEVLKNKHLYMEELGSID